MKWSGAKNSEPESDQDSRTEPAMQEAQRSGAHAQWHSWNESRQPALWKQARSWMGALWIRKQERDVSISHIFLVSVWILFKKTSY